MCLLLDETKDVSNVEQLVVHYRISDRGRIVQVFGAMLSLGTSQTGETIHAVVNDFLDGMLHS